MKSAKREETPGSGVFVVSDPKPIHRRYAEVRARLRRRAEKDLGACDMSFTASVVRTPRRTCVQVIGAVCQDGSRYAYIETRLEVEP